MSTNKKYTAGEIVTFTTGEYSDYSFHGPFRVLKDFDIGELAEAHTRGKEEWDTSPETFLAMLSQDGYVADVEKARQHHLGSYGNLRV